jgi:hypothetical protein
MIKAGKYLTEKQGARYITLQAENGKVGDPHYNRKPGDPYYNRGAQDAQVTLESTLAYLKADGLNARLVGSEIILPPASGAPKITVSLSGGRLSARTSRGSNSFSTPSQLLDWIYEL